MRNMSFSYTKEQIRNRTKFETRRLGWADLKPGELFCAIEKGQGLKKGEKVTRIVVLECLDNHLEELRTITRRSVEREGFPGMTPLEFVAMFCRRMGCKPEREVNAITFRYVLESPIPYPEKTALRYEPDVDWLRADWPPEIEP